MEFLTEIDRVDTKSGVWVVNWQDFLFKWYFAHTPNSPGGVCENFLFVLFHRVRRDAMRHNITLVSYMHEESLPNS